MLTRGERARAIAAHAGLFLMPVPTTAARGGVRLVYEQILEIGPGASDDEIATIACRRTLARAQIFDEREVYKLTQSYGFSYVCRAWTCACRAAS